MIDLLHNYPLPDESTVELIQSLGEKIKNNPETVVCYIPVDGLPQHREVAGKWLNVSPDRVAFGVSGHQFLTSIVLAFTKPNDKIACEEITYNGWLNITRHTGRTNVAIKSDENGMIPSALDEAASREKLWGVFLMPSLHNPLCTIMPVERRQEIIAVCRKHDLWVIDDDAYRFVNPNPPPSFAHLYPEKSFWIQSLTKPLFPGIKTALLAGPASAIPVLIEAIRATGHQPSGATLPWVLDLLESGNMDEIIKRKQEAGRARQLIATEVLKGIEYKTTPTSYHIWINVPEGWTPEGVAIVPGVRYFAGEGKAPDAYRVALAGEKDLLRVRSGLELIARQLRQN